MAHLQTRCVARFGKLTFVLVLVRLHVLEDDAFVVRETLGAALAPNFLILNSKVSKHIVLKVLVHRQLLEPLSRGHLGFIRALPLVPFSWQQLSRTRLCVIDVFDIAQAKLLQSTDRRLGPGDDSLFGNDLTFGFRLVWMRRRRG